MEGVLNETTMTVHKHETGTPPLRTTCGVSYHADPERLRTTPIDRATGDLDADKCGRCFEDGGGY